MSPHLRFSLLIIWVFFSTIIIAMIGNIWFPFIFLFPVVGLKGYYDIFHIKCSKCGKVLKLDRRTKLLPYCCRHCGYSTCKDFKKETTDSN